MGLFILQQVADIETDRSIKSKSIDAQNRLHTMEREQLEIPEIKLRQVGLRELFDHIYSRR